MSAAPSTNGRHRPRRAPAPRQGQVQKLLERTLPCDPSAEAAVLGSMILDWRVIGDVAGILRGPEDFYLPSHSAIYEAIVHLWSNSTSIDLVQLNTHLERKQLLEQVGGLDYLVELAEAVPSSASAGYYAKAVREKAMARQAIDALGRGLQALYESGLEAPEVIDKIEADIFAVSQQQTQATTAKAGDVLQEVYTRLEQQDGRTVTGLATGFFELDEMTSGFQPGDFLVLAARPSMGKTAFALNIAEHAALVMKETVAVFSLEMSRQQLGMRLLASRGGVHLQQLRRNMLSGEEFARLAEACGDISASDTLLINDQAGLTLMQLRAEARRLAARRKLALIVIDYLQLMNAPGHESRQVEVSAMSRGVKALARELSVPVLCLSQLNREAESRAGHRPRMSDLRESGSIEQDADVVMMLHREDYYERADPNYQPTNVAEVLIEKQRMGPTGTVKLMFDASSTRFKNLSQQQGGMW